MDKMKDRLYFADPCFVDPVAYVPYKSPPPQDVQEEPKHIHKWHKELDTDDFYCMLCPAKLSDDEVRNHYSQSTKEPKSPTALEELKEWLNEKYDDGFTDTNLVRCVGLVLDKIKELESK